MGALLVRTARSLERIVAGEVRWESMLLAIDVGNTNIVLGVFDGNELIRSWRLQTLRDRTADELGLTVDGLFAHGQIDRRAHSGRRARLGGAAAHRHGRRHAVEVLRAQAAGGRPGDQFRHADPLQQPVTKSAPTASSTPSPRYEQFGGNGRPLIVCDFGTATTLDAVSGAGEYLGGAICPGVTISADALFQRAARLPRIEVRKPETVVGRTTVGAMESGLFFGYVGMVEGLVRRMDAELGGNSICVATGGLAVVIAPETVSSSTSTSS